MRRLLWFAPMAMVALAAGRAQGDEAAWSRPYDGPRTCREEVFEFAEQPTVRPLDKDRYEIRFTARGRCDVTVAVLDADGKTIRRLAFGVLGPNAPAPLQPNSLSQTLVWDGKDDLKNYVREPKACRVRVSLGLKPTFERMLGWGPYDAAIWDVSSLYRAYRAIGIDASGVYVLSSRHPQLRHYDHQGRYVRTVLPPSADTPIESLAGMTTLEIEPGRRILHSAGDANAFARTVSKGAQFLEGAPPLLANACVVNGHLVWAVRPPREPVRIYRLNLRTGQNGLWEGPTRSAAAAMKRISAGNGDSLKLAASPDGRWLYLSGVHTYWGNGPKLTAVLPLDVAGTDQPGKPLGEPGKRGADNLHMTLPEGVDCDAAGRVYVCDKNNNRIQVFSAEATFLKSIPVDSPHLVRLDRKGGGIYVVQLLADRRSPKAPPTLRLLRLASFDDPTPRAALTLEEHNPLNWRRDPLMEVDYWTDPVRVWLCPDSYTVAVYEDRGEAFKLAMDFQEETRKAGLTPHMMNAGQWRNVLTSKVAANPVRDQLYFFGSAFDALRYDLATGRHEYLRLPTGDFYADRGFDGRGMLYTHINGSISRHDPERAFREVPFDYGDLGVDHSRELEVGKCIGVVGLVDQLGGRGYQDGFGVSIDGRMAVASNVYYYASYARDDGAKRLAYGAERWHAADEYAAFQEDIERRLKAGAAVYAAPAWPGRYLVGATLWVYNRRGELIKEDAIGGLGLVGGVQIDRDGNLYAVFDRTRMVNGAPFLAGRGAIIGKPGAKTADPHTATLIKTSPDGAKIFSRNAQIPMDHWPDRPMDVEGGWVQDAEWLYAGAGPAGLSPFSSSRHCTDWFGRSFVPENYRHSIGVLDSNGNLVMHVGQYGNADSAGPKSLVPAGGDGIGFCQVFGLSATDDRLCVSDFGNERIVVLKLDSHAQADVAVGR